MKKDDPEIFIDQKKAESPEFSDNFEEGYLNFKIGVILPQAREEMGATQADVTEKLNITKSVISRMENHAEDIKLSIFVKYTKAFWARRLSSKFSKFTTSEGIRVESPRPIQVGPLVRLLEDNGIEVFEAKKILPTLEDVFVKITGIEARIMKQEKEKKMGGNV